MAVVSQSLKDSVTQGGVADDLVPFLDGKLAGNQGRAEVVALPRILSRSRHSSSVMRSFSLPHKCLPLPTLPVLSSFLECSLLPISPFGKHSLP